jgi:Rrf2 family protein
VTFSAKTAYGLVALIELAGVHATGGTLQVGEIARRQGIPDRYLEQMLTSLRKAGILRSIRGPRGGFQLARQPAKVTVADVLACLEGDAQPERQGDRSTDEFCVLAGLEQKVEQGRSRVLAGTTLQQLLEERDARKQAEPMFYI